MKEIIERKDTALLSFETEVDSLNYKVQSLSKDLSIRKQLVESGEDQFGFVKQIMEEKTKLEQDLSMMQKNLNDSKQKLNELQILLRKTSDQLSVAREDLTVLKASKDCVEENTKARTTIEKLQTIWTELGVDSLVREIAMQKIQNCLVDTITRELDEALALKNSSEEKVNVLCYQIKVMNDALGTSSTNGEGEDIAEQDICILQRLSRLRDVIKNLEPAYRFSSARRQKILKELKDLMSALDLAESTLAPELKTLLFNETDGDIGMTVPVQESIINTKNSFVPLPKKCLQASFLVSCEGHVRDLRVKKSVILARSREIQQNIADLIEVMHLDSRESIELMKGWNERSEVGFPSWWDPKVAESVLGDLSRKKFQTVTSEKALNHLELMNKAFATCADCRRVVSDKLKSVIERAQKTLLDIVGREFDASEAYAGFHDALFRLPALSRDLILSCISEMEALIDGIEAMTQSEIEALTVVWEALKISSSDRRNFWGMVEKFDSDEKDKGADSLFSNVSLPPFSQKESWLCESITKAENVFIDLDKRLDKLNGIHNEVEKLRSRQDAKSKILSLDSEIRIMNAKLLEFEEFQCNKQRLLNKKNGGAALLKEERFRKQMQSKFISNLRQLASLLQSWEKQENTPFDASLLSEDVRMLLREPEKMENWVEERTKFMGLRTVKTHTPVKRSIGSLETTKVDRLERSTSVHTSGLSPPRKRTAILRTSKQAKPPPTGGALKKSVNGTGKEGVKMSKPMPNSGASLNLTERDVNSKDIVPRPSKRTKTKDSNSLLPFGNILSEMASPSHDKL